MLHFNEAFTHSLLWNNTFALRLATVHPHNKKQISEGLNHLSEESKRNRFLGHKKEFSVSELEYFTELDGWDHYAFGVEELAGPKRGIAIVRLVRSETIPDEAEAAITIIDEYQRVGLGTFLLKLMILAALERKINRISFSFLPNNTGMLKLIKHLGEITHGESTRDYHQVYLELGSVQFEEIKAQLRRDLPSIDDFRLKI